tara:strand:- start:10131 stop:10682 length:552 start_codon:yes stop_codon:yes gene_type:complete
MDLALVSEILGWTSIAFYISITVFNSMKITRFAAFGSTGNDIIWSLLMGWYPKLILNLSVTGVNAYRYAKDFTKAPLALLNTLAALMFAGIGYIFWFAVTNFLKDPTLSTGMQFADLGVILLALSMKDLKHYRILMLISGFVGMVGYYGNTQMMIIKAMVIGIMCFKLFIEKEKKENLEEKNS